MKDAPLSSFWFLFMVSMGAFFPYFAEHLSAVGDLTSTQVGIILACLPLMGIPAQLFWGPLSDSTGRRRSVVSAVTVLAGLSLMLIATLDDFSSLLLGTLILALFVTSVIPLMTALSLASLAERGASAYGGVRTWGTIGFLGSVTLLPLISNDTRDLLVMAGIASIASAVAIAFVHPGEIKRGLPIKAALPALLRIPVCRRMAGLSFLAFFAMQGPIQNFPLILKANGGGADLIGPTWVIMLVIEIPLLRTSSRFAVRVGPRWLFCAGLMGEAVRWSLTAFAPDLLTLQLTQALHGVGIVGLFVGLPLLLAAGIPRHLHSSAQTFVNVAGAGLGATLSNLVFGLMLEKSGPALPLLTCACAALAAALLCAIPGIATATDDEMSSETV